MRSAAYLANFAVSPSSPYHDGSGRWHASIRRVVCRFELDRLLDERVRMRNVPTLAPRYCFHRHVPLRTFRVQGCSLVQRFLGLLQTFVEEIPASFADRVAGSSSTSIPGVVSVGFGQSNPRRDRLRFRLDPALQRFNVILPIYLGGEIGRAHV